MVGSVTIFCVCRLPDFQSWCHLMLGRMSCRTSSLAVSQGGFPDLIRSFSLNYVRSVCIGNFRLLTHLVRSRMRERSLWMHGGRILHITSSHLSGVDFNVSPIILIAKLSCTSILLYTHFWGQTNAQYSTGAYTSARVLLRRVFTHLLPTKSHLAWRLSYSEC